MRSEPALMEPQWRLTGSPVRESCRAGRRSILEVQHGLAREFAQIVQAVKMTRERNDRDSRQDVDVYRAPRKVLQ